MPRSREILLPWDSQPQEAANIDWSETTNQGLLRWYEFNNGGRDAAGKLDRWSLGTLAQAVTPSGLGRRISAQRVARSGESLSSEISTGITALFHASKLGNISKSDFLFGETSVSGSTTDYNWGFYESSASSNLSFFVKNASGTGVYVSGTGRWATNNGPQIFIATYSAAEAEIRLYVRGDLVATIAQTGNIRQTALEVCSVCWNAPTVTPNFDFVNGGVWNRSMSAAEVKAVSDAIWRRYEPQTIWVPVSAGGGGATDLIIQEALHSHTADNIGLTLDTFLSVQEALHSHAADNLVLSVTGSTDLTVQETLHSHTADNLALTLDTFLLLQDALHAHAADNITLSTGAVADLVIQEALHAHTADALVLTLDTFLVIQEAAHAHGADNIAFTLDSLLAVQEALHGHLADNLILSIPGSALSDAEFRQMYDWISELHLVHGLRAGSPLTVTPTTRAAGIVDQTIGEVGTTVTVTRI